jgi:hypothetical protein
VKNDGLAFIYDGGKVEGGLTLAGGAAIIVGSVAAPTVTFAGPGGHLNLYNLPEFKAVIAGFGKGDQIDLGKLDFSLINSTVSFTSGTLTVTNGHDHAALTLSGPYSTSNFTLATDGGHGTLVTFT